MNASRWFDFELSPTVHLRLGDFDDRWAAIVRSGSTTTDGLGATARDALVAALAPLGTRATATLMAQPVMFGVSAKLLGVPA
jgi:hypothetical protein